jgi:hypothetical protein
MEKVDEMEDSERERLEDIDRRLNARSLVL